MSLRLRCLEVEVRTDNGPTFGVRLEFGDGLTVIYAPNTKGKSTCVNSIFYGLGLEGMLGPAHSVPLPAAMTDEILGDDGRKYEVLEAIVSLEIMNHQTQIVTVQRRVTNKPADRQLIQVTFAAALTKGVDDLTEKRTFHVRIPTSATAELGFHSFLADFLGWELPEVRRGTASCPLYLECTTPYLFVDQLNGWDAVKSRMPTQFGIVEVASRTFEFILRLDILQNEAERRRLESRLLEIEGTWRAERENLRRELAGSGIVDRGIPADVAEWKEGIGISLWILGDPDWIPVEESLSDANRRLHQLTASMMPQVADVSAELAGRLQSAEYNLSRAVDRLEKSEQDIREIEHDLIATRKRMDAIEDDLRQYEDEYRIRKRNESNPLHVTKGECPTCLRPIKDALINQNSLANPMSIPANIAFLRDQRRMFDAMWNESAGLLETKKEERTVVRARLSEATAEVQSLKRSLRRDAEAPSSALLREQINIENRISAIGMVLEKLGDPTKLFSSLAVEYGNTEAALKNLGARALSDRDRTKLKVFDDLHRSQLTDYGFSSYDPAEISIGTYSYQPEYKNSSLGLVSASDTVRLVWAYLIGILELGKKFDINHPGCLVIDEPRQQNVRIDDYDGFLARVSSICSGGVQVIIASSQLTDLDNLRNSGAKVIPFESRILQPRT